MVRLAAERLDGQTMKPYYEHDGITIYHGDCREVLPTLPVKAEMVFTDPPYGVDYDGGHFHSGDVNVKRAREKLQDDNGNVYAWIWPLLATALDGPAYVFFAGTRLGAVSASMQGWEVHAMLIWHKVNATYAAMNAQYKQRHEPILYCKPKGSTLRWCGPSTESTLWEVPRDRVNLAHPTQKPVQLATRAIANHDARLILDPFMGAGSTLIAAKDLRRKAIGIEIE